MSRVVATFTCPQPPVIAPSTHNETRHLTTHIGHVGMYSVAPATPSDSRRTVVNSTDCVFSADASQTSKANRSWYNLTTVLTTTCTDMSVPSRTHGPCCARREGRLRLSTNEHE